MQLCGGNFLYARHSMGKQLLEGSTVVIMGLTFHPCPVTLAASGTKRFPSTLLALCGSVPAILQETL